MSWTPIVTGGGSGASKLQGKIWNALGDSITAGAFNSADGVAYTQVVVNRTGCTVRNYGVSGTTFCDRAGANDTMIDRFPNMDNNADIITVMGGANDSAFGIANGTFDSRDPTNFYGACHVMIAGLLDKYPNGKVVMFTPLQRVGAHFNTLKGYSQVIKEVSAYYGVPVCDLFNESGITVNNTTNMNIYLPDGTHPQKLGHERIAERVQSFLESLF